MRAQARGPLSRLGHPGLRPVTLALVLMIALGGCGRVSTSSSTSSAHVSATKAPSLGRVVARAFDGPHVMVTAIGVYVAWFVSPPVSGVRTELARINLTSGRIKATRQLGAAYFDQAVAAGGSLWVATSSSAGETVLRLNPQTLAVDGRISIGGEGNQGRAGPSLALAGGWLWVDASDRLLRSSLRGRVTATVAVPGAVTSTIGTNSAGTMLVLGEANKNGTGVLERRDPTTGALLYSSQPTVGVVAPAVGGVLGSGIWAAEVTGMQGYVERYAADTLVPTPGTHVEGTNDITVEVADGMAWIYPSASGPGPSFCADPSSGRVLARLTLPQQGRILAIGPRQLFYAVPAPSGVNDYLETEPLPASCRT
jgi:hypothetical protein